MLRKPNLVSWHSQRMGIPRTCTLFLVHARILEDFCLPLSRLHKLECHINTWPPWDSSSQGKRTWLQPTPNSKKCIMTLHLHKQLLTNYSKSWFSLPKAMWWRLRAFSIDLGKKVLASNRLVFRGSNFALHEPNENWTVKSIALADLRCQKFGRAFCVAT